MTVAAIATSSNALGVRTRILFVIGIACVYAAVWIYTDGLSFPVYKDESQFWRETKSFADSWPPTLAQIRSYPEPMTPLSFLVWAFLEHEFEAGIAFGRHFNFCVSFVMLLMVGLHPTNLMTGFDLEDLDGHFFVRVAELGTPEYEMDLRALDHIARIISENERTFIYLVKSGAHFPYDAKYPPDRAFFQPTLSSGGAGGNLEKTLNSYRNALRWNVDGFIRSIFERFEGSGVDLLVVYTSDHGQSLADAVEESGPPRRGKPVHWPHAVPVDPPPQQASVPLILFAFDRDARAALASLYQPSLTDRVSAFEIFPSLLQLAGYDYEQIREYYEPSIFDAKTPRARRYFVSGNLFGIGGRFYQNELIREATYLNAFDPEE